MYPHTVHMNVTSSHVHVKCVCLLLMMSWWSRSRWRRSLCICRRECLCHWERRRNSCWGGERHLGLIFQPTSWMQPLLYSCQSCLRWKPVSAFCHDIILCWTDEFTEVEHRLQAARLFLTDQAWMWRSKNCSNVEMETLKNVYLSLPTTSTMMYPSMWQSIHWPYRGEKERNHNCLQ